MRGRKPKPTKLKELVGNPGKKPLNKSEPEYTPGAGPAPAILDQVGAAEWERISAIMTASGVLTEADRAVLLLYCSAWSEWHKLQEQLKATGAIIRSPDGVLYQNPILAVRNRTAETLAKMAASLGLDPTSRSRVQANKPNERPAPAVRSRKTFTQRVDG
jgi:P27 family predicted phage terminase small subunit